MRSDHPQLPPGVRLELGEAMSRCPKAAQEGREQQSGMHIHPGMGTWGTCPPSQWRWGPKLAALCWPMTGAGAGAELPV